MISACKKNIPNKIEEKIIEEAKAGAKQKEIAEKYGCTQGNVSKILRKFGIKTRGRGKRGKDRFARPGKIENLRVLMSTLSADDILASPKKVATEKEIDISTAFRAIAWVWHGVVELVAEVRNYLEESRRRGEKISFDEAAEIILPLRGERVIRKAMHLPPDKKETAQQVAEIGMKRYIALKKMAYSRLLAFGKTPAYRAATSIAYKLLRQARKNKDIEMIHRLSYRDKENMGVFGSIEPAKILHSVPGLASQRLCEICDKEKRSSIAERMFRQFRSAQAVAPGLEIFILAYLEDINSISDDVLDLLEVEFNINNDRDKDKQAKIQRIRKYALENIKLHEYNTSLTLAEMTCGGNMWQKEAGFRCYSIAMQKSVFVSPRKIGEAVRKTGIKIVATKITQFSLKKVIAIEKAEKIRNRIRDEVTDWVPSNCTASKNSKITQSNIMNVEPTSIESGSEVEDEIHEIAASAAGGGIVVDGGARRGSGGGWQNARKAQIWQSI